MLPASFSVVHTTRDTLNLSLVRVGDSISLNANGVVNTFDANDVLNLSIDSSKANSIDNILVDESIDGPVNITMNVGGRNDYIIAGRNNPGAVTIEGGPGSDTIEAALGQTIVSAGRKANGRRTDGKVDVITLDQNDAVHNLDRNDRVLVVDRVLEEGITACSDGEDNNDQEDDLADQFDPGCHTDANAANTTTYNPDDNDESNGVLNPPVIIISPNPECSNTVDDDGDGKVDGADADCVSPQDDQEQGPIIIPTPQPQACVDLNHELHCTVNDFFKAMSGPNSGDVLVSVDQPWSEAKLFTGVNSIVVTGVNDDAEGIFIENATMTPSRLRGADGCSDTIIGGSGNDTILGLGGDDQIFARAGNDSIDGGIGHDTLFGEGGNDVIIAGAGHDLLDGGSEADTLGGEQGNDTLQGGDGPDRLTGGEDFDTFNVAGGNGPDELVDRQPEEPVFS